MRRSLTYYWRTHLAVVCGAAVATAVLTGALLVGDSVRGSLRDLTLSRLGDVDVALIGERPFGEGLGERFQEELGEQLRLAPVLLLRGSAIHGETRTRASEVSLLGIDGRFSELYPGYPAIGFESVEGGIFPPVVLNRALAEELGANVGDQVLLSFERPAEIPRETLVGRQDASETIRVLRLSVAAIADARGPGSFALTQHQGRPFNAYLELGRLQRALFGREGSERVNLLLSALPTEPETITVERLEAALQAGLGSEDMGLVARRQDDHLAILSREFVLRPTLGEALDAFASAEHATSQPVLTYLANSISGGGRSVPYSTISALDPVPAPELGPFELIDGTSAPRLADDEILLNAWTAEDLGVEPGDEIEIAYFIVGERDELSTESTRFRLRGVLAMTGLAVDSNLTPEFPGIQGADDMSAWDPPFPIDLDLVRERDEAYWDEYGSAPKAFVSEATGRRLWRSRFGDLTSVRLAGGDVADLESALNDRLARHVDLSAAGLSIRPLKEEGLRGSKGATDFAGLFLALSMFLIAAAAMLVGLLFRLGVEQRAREIGLLRSVGFRNRSVRGALLAEGGLLAVLGAFLGLLLALLYAWLMLVGLRTWWLPAVGTPVLFLHAEPLSLIIGWTVSVAIVLFSIWWSLRKLHKIPAPALLAGSTAAVDTATRPKRARAVAIVCALLALALLVWAVVAGTEAAAGPAFGIGACLLVGGLAWFSYRIGGGRRRANSLGSLAAIGMGARNSGRNRGRSLLSVGLVASACFIIVVVAANRVGIELDVEDPTSGAGGFTLIAESDVALVTDLNRPESLMDLGFAEDEARRLERLDVFPMRLLPGEDVSCLNLYRPERPRVLGVPHDMIERGGFTFQQVIELESGEVVNPWELLETELEPGVVPAIADNNSALWVMHVGLGDDIVMVDEAGREVSLRLVGLLARSVFQSEVLISEESFKRLYPSRTGYSVFLADPPAEEASEVAGVLEATLEDYGFDVTGTADRIESFLAVEHTYMSTFQTLGGLGLILGTVGLGIVLLRNVLERRSELATLRAFGYRRSTLSWMVLSENGALLVAGIAIGTLAGLVASAPYLIAAGSRLPWPSLLTTLAVVFGIGMLASVLAVAGTLRVPLLPALKAD